MRVIGIDTGGTFTDFVLWDGHSFQVHKQHSSPHNPANAILAGLDYLAEIGPFQVVHGSTVATNAILERKGAKTFLVTNKGFEDVIEIGRQNRSRLYSLSWRREAPLVPADRRYGIACRVDSQGEIIQEMETDDLLQMTDAVRRSQAEAVAVSLLFSFLKPDHEKRVGEALADCGVPVTLSHEILSEFREYERTATAVLNAYVRPKMERYLRELSGAARVQRLRIMQSNGGSITVETAMREPVRTILSGPAGGVVGAWEIGSAAGHSKLISFDMGGTSTDVSLIDQGLSMTAEAKIGGYPVRVPMLDIHTVGAGGGSIAAVDSGGALTVGPHSAGSDPGPVCYGKGEAVTVTDANLFLGRLIPERFLGGRVRLYPERTMDRIRRMAAENGMDARELAEGILSVANAKMERAIRVITVEKGIDPREFTLFSFGGAGGLHAAFLAGLLDIQRILVPANPGLLSAMGMLAADVVKDYSRTVMWNQETAESGRELEEMFRRMEMQGMAELAAEGVPEDAFVFRRFLDMRYRGQSYELLVPAGEEVVQRFHELHQQRYGYFDAVREVEVVNVRLRAGGRQKRPVLRRGKPGAASAPSSTALLGKNSTVFDGNTVDTPVYLRDALAVGNRLAGPAIVVEFSSTIVLPPATEAEVDEWFNLNIRV